jgi:hypothetical protein
MEWRCTECGETESGRNADLVVCHHCGKLLCREDRMLVSNDVFDGDGLLANLAYHCWDCYDTHHLTPVDDAEQPA